LDSVEFLGHVITKEGIAVNPSKVQSVLEWNSPKNAKEIRGFIGMTGYYVNSPWVTILAHWWSGVIYRRWTYLVIRKNVDAYK
jgi:hypothetical protein